MSSDKGLHWNMCMSWHITGTPLAATVVRLRRYLLCAQGLAEALAAQLERCKAGITWQKLLQGSYNGRRVDKAPCAAAVQGAREVLLCQGRL